MDPAAGDQPDKLLIDLKANGGNPIQDWTGDLLDGEWTNGSSRYPSGNGTAGSDFLFRFNVLPGDADQNGLVRRTTGCWFAGPWGQRPDRPSIRLSRISTATARLRLPTAAVKSALGAVLPAGNPVAGPFRSFAPLLTTGAAERRQLGLVFGCGRNAGHVVTGCRGVGRGGESRQRPFIRLARRAGPAHGTVGVGGPGGKPSGAGTRGIRSIFQASSGAVRSEAGRCGTAATRAWGKTD